MINQKPFAPSADRNKDAILEVLQTELAGCKVVFEFGSGSGQHACYFASNLPDISWQPSDLIDKLDGINQWIKETTSNNILEPIPLDLTVETILPYEANACFTANTFHIVSLSSVQQLFKQSNSVLKKQEKLLVYGPFSYNGVHNSPGNKAFDEQLRLGNPQSGIRDITELNQMAVTTGFDQAKSIPMPANNQILIWTKLNEL